MPMMKVMKKALMATTGAMISAGMGDLLCRQKSG